MVDCWEALERGSRCGEPKPSNNQRSTIHHHCKAFMPTETEEIQELADREYEWGFVTDIEADTLPPGLNEDVVRFISKKKNEPDWMLQARLKAYRHWLTMEEPHHWAHLKYPPIDYQASSYFSAPKPKLNSLDEVDP